MVGKQNGCTYDMSENTLKIQNNIYALFGFTHKDVTEQKDGEYAGNLLMIHCYLFL